MTVDDFTQSILDEAQEENRCPNLRIDDISPYCARGLENNHPVTEERRNICDHASLQLYCLDKKRHSICIWYNGESFLENLPLREIIRRIPLN